ncbi:MAG: glycoside hydrolase family 16 protein [Muribaculaceae bacterium]|nr:glycoside hydrolase family 16 protein [Muribaculaceae bacterium]
MKHTLSAICVAAFALAASAADVPTYPGYELIWADEFDVDGRPAPHWNYEQGFVRNNELQWYQPDNASVADGCLIITGRLDSIPNPNYEEGSADWRRNRKEARYSSSCLTTSDSFQFKFGRMEVRARIPVNSGAWPAIWTLGTKYRWPRNGEVDVLEYYRRSEPIILANACWQGPGNEVTWDEGTVPYTHFTDKDPFWASKFHVWRMDWDKDYIRLYLDDELMNEIPLAPAAAGGGNNRELNPFSNDDPDFGHYILLNLALGGNGGEPDDASFPLRYEVDYVRVYKKL